MRPHFQTTPFLLWRLWTPHQTLTGTGILLVQVPLVLQILHFRALPWSTNCSQQENYHLHLFQTIYPLHRGMHLPLIWLNIRLTPSSHHLHFPQPLANHLRHVVRLTASPTRLRGPHFPQLLTNHLCHIIRRPSIHLMARSTLSPRRPHFPQLLASRFCNIIRRPPVRSTASSTPSPQRLHLFQPLVNHLRHAIHRLSIRPMASLNPSPHTNRLPLGLIRLVSRPIPQLLLVGRLSRQLQRGQFHPLFCFPRLLEPAVRSSALSCVVSIRLYKWSPPQHHIAIHCLPNCSQPLSPHPHLLTLQRRPYPLTAGVPVPRGSQPCMTPLPPARSEGDLQPPSWMDQMAAASSRRAPGGVKRVHSLATRRPRPPLLPPLLPHLPMFLLGWPLHLTCSARRTSALNGIPCSRYG